MNIWGYYDITSLSYKKLAHAHLVSEMGAAFKPGPDARAYVFQQHLPDCTHDFANLISSPISLNFMGINVAAACS